MGNWKMNGVIAESEALIRDLWAQRLGRQPMLIPHVDVPSLGRRLSRLMAAPSSAEPETHVSGLDTFHRLGGNCLHLHGEGGETHSRRAAGNWLRERGLRGQFFVCTQICHDDWDEGARQPVDRYTPQAVMEDIAADLALLQTDYLDLVYLDDRPMVDYRPIVDSLADEVTHGRVRALGVRNWTPDRFREAHAHLQQLGAPGIAAIITTELSLPVSVAPLWPGYVPFDAAMDQVAIDLGLAVFAHISDFTLGQIALGDADTQSYRRREWIDRWDHPVNSAIARQVQALAVSLGATPREVNIAWLLSRPYPTIGILSLPELLSRTGAQVVRANYLHLDEAAVQLLDTARGNRPTGAIARGACPTGNTAGVE